MKSPYGPFGMAPRDRRLSSPVPAAAHRAHRGRACPWPLAWLEMDPVLGWWGWDGDRMGWALDGDEDGMG